MKMKDNDSLMIPEEVILNKIYHIRGKKVMLDMDLAELYGVENKQLKRAVRRNITRFPEDFMFELQEEEFRDLRSHFGTSRWGGTRYPPMVFTEQGVAMLSSVLNSERAIQVNIRIMRIFTGMRDMLLAHQDLVQKIKEMDKALSDHDEKILLIFEYLKQLEQEKQQQADQAGRGRIGFKK
jgi:phage regulator Rha-like protein